MWMEKKLRNAMFAICSGIPVSVLTNERRELLQKLKIKYFFAGC